MPHDYNRFQSLTQSDFFLRLIGLSAYGCASQFCYTNLCMRMSEQPATTVDGLEASYIDAARRGDLAAFNWLVLQYQTRVYNLCLRMLSDPDAAADATQEAFLSAYRAMDRFKGGNFRSWLLRIASNACLDALRARNRHPAQSLERGRSTPGSSATLGGQWDDEEEPLQVADPALDADPEGQALSAETAATIQAGLDTLPEDQRIALVLVDVQGLSYEEAAAVAGANLGTVKSRINRARLKMRDYLRGVGIVSAKELSEHEERLNVDG
jgi:RNA polymerase sigma factor (sigma-70 family)